MQFKPKKLPFSKQQLLKAGPPPPGTYEFAIVAADVVPARRGSGETFKMRLEVTTGEHEGREVPLGYSLGYLEPVATLFKATGLLDEDADSFTTEDLIDCVFVADLEFEEREDGGKWARLRNPRPSPDEPEAG